MAMFSVLYGFFILLYGIIDHARGILFEGDVFAGEVFLTLTLILGGAGAYANGRAIALTWRPLWQAFIYCLPLSAAVQFLHYALFQETLLSLHYFLVTFLILCVISAIGFRKVRVLQMTGQYSWIFKKSNPFQWGAVGEETNL